MPESYASIEVRLLEALNTLYTQTLPNVTQAARDFNVPYQRLLARFYGVQSKQDRPASGRKLTDVEELAVCQYLNQLDKMGTSARLSMLVGCANSILRAREADSTTQPPTISAAWSKRFLRRHPEYKMKKQQSLEIARKNSHDPEHILWWFAQYSKVRLENGIADEDVWNFDETGFRIGVGKSQWIITRDLTRKSFLASDNNRKTVTCIETVSGSGSVIPVFLILPGVIHQARWYEEVEDGTAIALSDSGYANDEISFEYIKHFETHTRRGASGNWRLLICDGYASHSTKEFIDYCEEHRIKLFLLPSHTSHLLQPLDVVLFQPYKHYHAEAIDRATRTGCDDFNIMEILAAIGSIRKQTFKYTSIRSAFRKTGLIPYRPEVVLNNMREHEYKTPPSTPHRTAIEWPTPMTTRGLKRQAEHLTAAQVSPITRRCLDSFLKGSVAQALCGQQVAADLDRQQAAQNARRRRETASKKHLQKGGVLTSKNARSITTKWVEDEVIKAQ